MPSIISTAPFAAAGSVVTILNYNVPSLGLILAVDACHDHGVTGGDISSITYGGVPLIVLANEEGPGTTRIVRYYMINPPVGNANIVITWIGAPAVSYGAPYLISGADLSNPFGTTNTADSGELDDTSVSTSVASQPGKLILDGVITQNATATVGPGQSQIYNELTSLGGRTIRYMSSQKTAGSFDSMTWTLSPGRRWLSLVTPVNNPFLTYTTSYIYKFTNTEETDEYIFPRRHYDFSYSQELRSPRQHIVSQNYATRMLGIAPALKEVGKADIKFLLYDASPTALASMRKEMEKCYTFGLGYLHWTTGERALASLAEMPPVQITWDNPQIMPTVLTFDVWEDFA